MARALLVSLIALLTGCRDQILHDLSETQANRLVTRLQEARIDTVREKQADGRWAISVETSDAVRAMKVLDQSRLIRDTTAPPERSSLMVSREDQHFKFERALSHELEGTLESLEGVVEAKVHLSLQPLDPLLGTASKRSTTGQGSVLLVTDERFHVEPSQVAVLVAGAAGLAPAQVSVLVNTLNASPREDRGTAAGQGAGAAPLTEGQPSARAVESPSGAPGRFAQLAGVPPIALFLFGAVLLTAGASMLRKGVPQRGGPRSEAFEHAREV